MDKYQFDGFYGSSCPSPQDNTSFLLYKRMGVKALQAAKEMADGNCGRVWKNNISETWVMKLLLLHFPRRPVIFSDDLECPVTYETHSILVPLLFSEGEWIPWVLYTKIKVSIWVS